MEQDLLGSDPLFVLLVHLVPIHEEFRSSIFSKAVLSLSQDKQEGGASVLLLNNNSCDFTFLY